MKLYLDELDILIRSLNDTLEFMPETKSERRTATRRLYKRLVAERNTRGEEDE